MKTIKYPQTSQWPSLCTRPTFDISELESTVKDILDDVRERGNAALLEMGKKFDGVELDGLEVNLKEHSFEIDEKLAEAIKTAKKNIETFHLAQKENVLKVETMKGVSCWRKSVAIQNVGLYIPGGSAPLFSTLLMLAIPAKIAGCKNIVVCTPPSLGFDANNAP